MFNGMVNDPYTVLGVSRDATLQQVRSRYFELARKHHPDKLGNVSEEEKKNHEAIFKDISNAYSEIEDRINKNGNFNYSSDNYEHHSRDDWRSIWNDLEVLFQTPGTWERVASIVKNTVHDVTVEGIKQLKTHHVKINVTLEEVHAKKKKRIRLILANVEEPIFVILDIGEYPIMDVKHITPNGFPINIAISMELIPHPVFRLDDVLDSWDLFCEIDTTLVDFFNGKDVILNYFGKDIVVNIEPFKKHDLPICIKDHGLCGLGNLYISINMKMPKQECKSFWDKLSDEKRKDVLSSISDLYM
jgi:DnaJ-class molecular chaperone